MKQIDNLIDEVITMTGLLLHLEAGGVDLPIEESLLDKYKQLLVGFCFKVEVLKSEEKNSGLGLWHQKRQIDQEIEGVLAATNILIKCEMLNLNQLFEVEKEFKSTLIRFCSRVALMRGCNDN